MPRTGFSSKTANTQICYAFIWFLGASGGRNRTFRKSCLPNQYFGTFWQKSQYTTPVTVILGQNGAKWRESAVFAKKCTFWTFGLPGGSQNDSNSLGFGARAPLGPILTEKCTLSHFSAKRAPWGPRIAIGLGLTHRIAVGQGSPRLSV